MTRAVKAVKVVVFLAALVPAALLVRGMLTGTLGVNPAETIQLTTGRWALKFLLLTLAVTPVRRITGWNVVIRYRRMLGNCSPSSTRRSTSAPTSPST